MLVQNYIGFQWELGFNLLSKVGLAHSGLGLLEHWPSDIASYLISVGLIRLVIFV